MYAHIFHFSLVLFRLKDICPYSSNTSDDEEDLDREDGSNTVSKFRWLLDPSDSCIQIALVGQLDNLGKLRQDIKVSTVGMHAHTHTHARTHTHTHT